MILPSGSIEAIAKFLRTSVCEIIECALLSELVAVCVRHYVQAMECSLDVLLLNPKHRIPTLDYDGASLKNLDA